MIAGVCGGIAEWLGWKADRVRVAYVIVYTGGQLEQFFNHGGSLAA